MVNALTEDNRKSLIRAGFEPTQENLYLAHQQGASGAIKLLKGKKTKQVNLTSNGVTDYASWKNKFSPKFK